jgi:hypothetical protein
LLAAAVLVVVGLRRNSHESRTRRLRQREREQRAAELAKRD